MYLHFLNEIEPPCREYTRVPVLVPNVILRAFIPSYAAWGHPGSNDGIKYKLLMHLDRIVQPAGNDIHARITNPTMSSFLENMLERSQEFVRKLFTFITDTYTELMRSFNDD